MQVEKVSRWCCTRNMGGNESMVESIVAYTSRPLSAAEKNHRICVGELKFLALKWTITDQFRDYL